MLQTIMRVLLKAHVKGHYRVQNGKVVYIADYDTKVHGEHPQAELHQRTAMGVHKEKGPYLRATDAQDLAAIKLVADELGVKIQSTRRAGANHHGRVGAYDHVHFASEADAAKVMQGLEHGVAPKEQPAPGPDAGPPKPVPVVAQETPAPEPAPAAPVEPPAPPPAPEPPKAAPWTPSKSSMKTGWGLTNTLPGHNKSYRVEVHQQPNGKFCVLAAWGKTGKAQVQFVKWKDVNSLDAADDYAGQLVKQKMGNGYELANIPPLAWDPVPGIGQPQDQMETLVKLDHAIKAEKTPEMKAGQALGMATALDLAENTQASKAASGISSKAYAAQYQGNTQEAVKFHAAASLAHASMAGLGDQEAFPPAQEKYQGFHMALFDAHSQLATLLNGEDPAIVSVEHDPVLAKHLDDWAAMTSEMDAKGMLGIWPHEKSLAANKGWAQLQDMRDAAKKRWNMASAIQSFYEKKGNTEEAASWAVARKAWFANYQTATAAMDIQSEEANKAAAAKPNPKYADTDWMLVSAKASAWKNLGEKIDAVVAGDAPAPEILPAGAAEYMNLCKLLAVIAHHKGLAGAPWSGMPGSSWASASQIWAKRAKFMATQVG